MICLRNTTEIKYNDQDVSEDFQKTKHIKKIVWQAPIAFCFECAQPMKYLVTEQDHPIFAPLLLFTYFIYQK